VVAGGVHPVGGVDYPRTWAEFHAWFGDDGACLRFLEGLRWPAGFVCPHCGRTVGWRSARGRFTCGDCGVQTSVTAGTIFHGTRTPLVSWFAAMWYLTNQKNGVSALGLSRVLGIDYKTAWTWLHKLRRAMVRPDRDLLDGPVEVDETYVGGPEQGLHGRQTITKSIVAIAIETRGKGFGRVRLHQMPDLSADSLVGFVTHVVAAGGIVRTDAWQGYRPLERAGYRHERTSIRAGTDPSHVVMPGVHRVASLLKRWLLGTHQGSVSTEHLDYYLDEFTFRFNRRTARARGLLFYRLAQQAVRTDPHPYKDLIGGETQA
jgi:transposase-like protein